MKLIRFILALLFVLAGLNLSAAQQKFEFKKIDFTYRNVTAENTTVVGLDRNKFIQLGKPQNWGMVETMYDSEPKWADDIEVKYYVLMKGDSPKKPVMLTGSVVYISVQKGRGHVSNIYIPPQAILRYGEVVKVRAELWYNGILEDSTQWPKGTKEAQWWTKVKPTSGSLFNRYYTPFEHEAQCVEEVIKIN